MLFVCFFFKQMTAYEMRISDWSSDVCSSDLARSMGFHGVLWGSAAERPPPVRHGGTFFRECLTGGGHSGRPKRSTTKVTKRHEGDRRGDGAVPGERPIAKRLSFVLLRALRGPPRSGAASPTPGMFPEGRASPASAMAWLRDGRAPSEGMVFYGVLWGSAGRGPAISMAWRTQEYRNGTAGGGVSWGCVPGPGRIASLDDVQQRAGPNGRHGGYGGR